jgi:biopolymer transport protein TolR
MGMSGGSREINMTPLIDVLLVLLVIFLVAMPMMMRMQTVQMPPTVQNPEPSDPPPIVLHLEGDLTISIEDGPRIVRGDLPRELRKRARPAQPVFVDFDDMLPWSEVVSLLDSIKATLDDSQLALRMRPAPT